MITIARAGKITVADNSIADQIASQPVNRLLDRLGAVARSSLQVCQFDKLGDDRRRPSGPIEADSGADGTPGNLRQSILVRFTAAG